MTVSKTNLDSAKLENKLAIAYQELDTLKSELVYKDEEISCLIEEINCLNQELKNAKRDWDKSLL